MNVNMKRQTDYKEKPYNRCLSCQHRQVRCDGPRTSSLPLARWCELMRDLKELNGLTNAYIAQESGVSIKTVERLMAQNSDKDILRETARRIENVIMGTENQNPCYLAFEEENEPKDKKLNKALRELERTLVEKERVQADNVDCRKAMDDMHESYQSKMEAIRLDNQKKIDFLVGQLTSLRADNERLWAENERKTKMIDRFVENKTGFVYQLVEHKTE